MTTPNQKKLTNISASLSTNPMYDTSYSNYNRNLLQQEIDREWQYATDLFTIEEELIKGSNVFSFTDVRINHVLPEQNTGTKLGDDWRSIIFKNIDHVYGIGHKYKFNDNFWITIQTDFYKFVTASAVIRRCNNVLRYFDEYGNKIIEPCIINYDLKNTSNKNKSSIITERGDIEIIVQYNDNTKKIKPNQRFLFGDPRKAYKVRGDGINNFLNQKTTDDTSNPLIYLYLDANQVNPYTDDLLNGFADAYIENYAIQINQQEFSQVVGNIGQLTCTKTLNNIENNFLINWSSNNNSIATIDNNGNYELLSSGDVTFTCSMVENNIVNDSIVVHSVLSGINEYEIVIDNQITEIKQTNQQIYNVYLYKDGVIQSDTFIFNASGVPSENYVLNILSGNSFSITNVNMWLKSDLIIDMQSGLFSKSLSVKLIGLW